MSIDLTKLTPAPWKRGGGGSPEGVTCASIFRNVCGPWDGGRDDYFSTADADMAFIVLARNAFDVMMRRRWGVICIGTVSGQGLEQFWTVDTDAPTKEALERIGQDNDNPALLWPGPFTALVEADRWYRQNVEAGQP